LFSFQNPIYTKVKLKVNPDYTDLYWSCLEASITTDLSFVTRLVEVKKREINVINTKLADREWVQVPLS